LRLRWRSVPTPAAGSGHRFRRSSDAVGVEQGGRTVLLDGRSEEYFALDEVGSRIWALLDQPRTVDAIADELTRIFDAPADRIRQDVVDLLVRLTRERLVVGA
jgi:hypothetical protein